MARRRGSWLVVVVGLLTSTFTAQAMAAPPARLRIKNAHTITVALGRARESASAIRPDKKVWTLELSAELVGAAAEFQDVTPNAPAAHWTLPIATEHLVLDGVRFLPSHVYRVEVRRDRELIGNALVYLSPPPVERVKRVVLDDRPESDDAHAPASGEAPTVTPKSGL
jgi:hypothetical protein